MRPRALAGLSAVVLATAACRTAEHQPAELEEGLGSELRVRRAYAEVDPQGSHLAPARLAYEVRFADRVLVLDLFRNDQLFAEGYEERAVDAMGRLTDAVSDEARQPGCYYQGRVRSAGEPLGSGPGLGLVALRACDGLSANRLAGWLELGDESFEILGDEDGDGHQIVPLRRRISAIVTSMDDERLLATSVATVEELARLDLERRVELTVVNTWDQMRARGASAEVDAATRVNLIDAIFQQGSWVTPFRVVLQRQLSFVGDRVPVLGPGATLVDRHRAWGEATLPSSDHVMYFHPGAGTEGVVVHSGHGTMCDPVESVSWVEGGTALADAAWAATYGVGRALGIPDERDAGGCGAENAVMNITPCVDCAPSATWSACSFEAIVDRFTSPQASCLLSDTVASTVDPSASGIGAAPPLDSGWLGLEDTGFVLGAPRVVEAATP